MNVRGDSCETAALAARAATLGRQAGRGRSRGGRAGAGGARHWSRRGRVEDGHALLDEASALAEPGGAAAADLAGLGAVHLISACEGWATSRAGRSGARRCERSPRAGAAAR